MFCGTDLAARIEAAEAELIVAATRAAAARGVDTLTVPVAGGYACLGGDGAPMNKVVGLGFAGLPDDWEDVERAVLERGAPVSVEVAGLADPDIAATLTARGYRLVGFENVLGCPLPVGGVERASDVEVRAAGPDDVDAWVDVVVAGFAHPDAAGVPTHEDFPRAVVDAAMRDFVTAGAVPYVAMVDGQVAGGGSLRLTDGVAQLTGAATAPAFRRRGVQAALLAARLAAATDAGCDVAVVTTAPGSTSQKNVQAKGFHLLYTRAILTKS